MLDDAAATTSTSYLLETANRERAWGTTTVGWLWVECPADPKTGGEGGISCAGNGANVSLER